MKIVVLCGGLSPERNVSLSSGTRIAASLNRLGHKVVLLDMYFGLENWDGDRTAIFDAPPAFDSVRVAEEAPDLRAVAASRRRQDENLFGDGVLEVCRMADVVFMALHGSCGEDGRVQAAFDLLGIRYTGSGYLGSAVAMDKDMTKRLVAPKGVLTPAWEILDTQACDLLDRAETAELPLVVKPADSGSSIGVSIARTGQELREALALAAGESRYILLEQYIHGREIQVGILGGEALPPIEIITRDNFYDYKNKYQMGMAREICPCDITPELDTALREAALTVFRTLGLRAYSRADFIVDAEGRCWFLEINTLPGMTPTSLLPQEAAAVGIDYDTLCQRVIDLAMED